MTGEDIGLLVYNAGLFSFSGTVTGIYSGNGLVVGPGLLGPYAVLNETDIFGFSGRWNNGWYSIGTFTGNLNWKIATGEFGYSGSYNGNIVTLTSTTPEPSSFLLFGSSLLGAAGMLRRRLKF